MSADYILEIKTVQAPTFKLLVDALKEILIDVNLEFDETGLRVVALDNTHVVLVHMKLNADQFETYQCKRKLYVGINMLKLHMLIKTIGNNDVLTLFIEENDPNKLGVLIENPEKNVRTIYKLSLLDINVVNIKIPPADFQVTVTMPSVHFQKIIRDMHNLADFLEVRNVEDQLCFTCKGEFCTQETFLGTDKNSGLVITRPDAEMEPGEGGAASTSTSTADHEIIQGVFSLKYMSMFTKFTNLCATVEIHLKNNFPLILRYRVASLGTLSIFLAQQDVDV